MKWIEVYNNDYFNIEYKLDENLIYVSYKDEYSRFDNACFPLLNFNEQCEANYWDKIYEDLSFIVDYNYDKKWLRVSHFVNYHFDDDIVINFVPSCMDCKYFNAVGDNYCGHDYKCIGHQLWWPKEKKKKNK